MYIPVNRPLISSADIESVTAALREGWISGEGPYIQNFENELANRISRKYVIAVSNGTIALEMALRALDCKAGDEVIIPTFSIISLVQAVLRVGATPVLVDSDPSDWNMNIDQVILKTSSRTKAIIAMHTYGLCVNAEPLLKHCRRNNIRLIEDAAEALGQSCCNQPTGSLGDISTFSFYANKLITTGEGGAICTDDLDIFNRLKSLRNLCFSNERRFLHHELGYNARLSSIQAALGSSQIKSWNTAFAAKLAIANVYNQTLKTHGIQLPLQKNLSGENGYWVYGIVLDPKFKTEASRVINELDKMSVGSRPFFWCAHEQPVLKDLFSNEKYPVAENLARYGLYLPSGVGTTLEEAKKAAEIFNQVWEGLIS